jgi:hypothetical protein
MSPRPRQRDRGLPEGLFLDGSRFLFRRQISPELRARLGRREVYKSLGTSDELEARCLACVEAVLAERSFHEAREQMILEEATAGLVPHLADALTRLAALLAAEQDATRRAILAGLVSRLGGQSVESSPSGDTGDLTMSQLLEAWREAEKPPLPEFYAIATGFDRFVRAMGDRRLADVTPPVVEEFAHHLETVPYQKGGQPLHRSGREATMFAIRSLLRWRDEGGLERAQHAKDIGAG